MTLVSGTLTIQPGTRIEISGPVIWTIAPGAEVVNNGEIDLGDAAFLIEQTGTPITGTGTERVFLQVTPPFSAEPGGLGLTISSSDVAGDVEVVRGHIPALAGNGSESVARWYGLTSGLGPMTLALEIDPTELNGIPANDLTMHAAQVLSGPWAVVEDAAYDAPYTVLGSTPGGGVFLTAFEGIVTLVPPVNREAGFLVWPTITDGIVHVRAADGMTIRHWELRDMAGRLVHQGAGIRHDLLLDLGQHVSGMYLLAVNGTHAAKLVRQ